MGQLYDGWTCSLGEVPHDDETAEEWLRRAGYGNVADMYCELKVWLKANGSGERRALWDILSGEAFYDVALRKGVLHRFGRTFIFPTFVEAAKYRGVAPRPRSIRAGVRPQTHRKPQVTKWGPKLRNLK